MTKTFTKIEKEALKLTLTERAKLMLRLVESLDEKVDSDAEKLWAKEIDKRLDLDDQGKLKYVPAKKVLSELRSLKRR
jgi:putative addiction module component (TIGR02574 family)